MKHVFKMALKGLPIVIYMLILTLIIFLLCHSIIGMVIVSVILLIVISYVAGEMLELDDEIKELEKDDN